MAITMQNQLRFASNYDAEFVLSDTQTETSDAGGKDSGGNADYVDLGDYAGTLFAGHIRLTAADYTTGDEAYAIEIHSSSATNFSTYEIEKECDLPITATVSSGNVYYSLGAFSPQNRYLRAYINVGGTSPSITIDKIWISPLG